MPARAEMPLKPPVWPWVVVSIVAHAIILWVTFGVWGAGALRLGRGAPTGDGFGGRSIELEVRGPRDAPATGALPGEGFRGQASAHVEPQRPNERSAGARLEGELTVDLGQGAERTRAPEDGASEPEPEPQAARGRERVARALPQTGDSTDVAGDDEAPGEALESGGTGDEGTTAGTQAGDPAALILGAAGLGGTTVTARRALLPGGGACQDPVAGTWRSQKYRSGDRTWVRFMLDVSRDADTNALTGTITGRIWSGSAGTPVPGECTAFGMDHTWRMRARGHFDGRRMTFGSSRARLVRADCPNRDTQYAPDNFSGSVDVMREVFDAINNDGAFDIDEPYTFRRVSCE
ncbi:MAG: hypothetical protein VYE22_18275 [Myxococcota bacterium]|nr:hypothetical protein [Myxococcota bacterium]